MLLWGGLLRGWRGETGQKAPTHRFFDRKRLASRAALFLSTEKISGILPADFAPKLLAAKLAPLQIAGY